MKKIIAALTAIVSLLLATPAFAYTVKSGDTMYKIARENGLSLQELENLNPQIQDLDIIYAGQVVHTGAVDGTESTETLQLTPISSGHYSEYEIDLLARLVRAEANGEPYLGKVAVADVVLNRVESPAFPDTIEEVIYQKGQFQPVANGHINQPADEESRKAVTEALSGNSDAAGGSLFFYNPVTATSRWLDSRETAIVIGNHVFKK